MAPLVEDSTDFAKLLAALHDLVGKKCWKVAFTHGGELSLHFGRHLSYDIPSMTGKKKGEWHLGTRGTPWKLFTPHGSVSSRGNNEELLEGKANALEGRKVTRINIGVPDNALTIDFGNEHQFQITPTGNSVRSSLPYWELFMPNHRLLTFGPGSSWSCRRSDVPVSKNGK